MHPAAEKSRARAAWPPLLLVFVHSALISAWGAVELRAQSAAGPAGQAGASAGPPAPSAPPALRPTPMPFLVPPRAPLIGRPAPPLTVTDLSGQPLDLQALRGRVVLLDFWATWCAPCVRALPEVQRIADAFKGRPVTIIGVNRDFPGAEAHVRRQLEKEGITFQQIMDPSSDVAGKFGVRGIPCHVLIDAQGIVQDWYMGYGPGMEAHVKDQIERLLAGESLFDPAAVGAPAPALAAGGAADSGVAPSLEVRAPERLTPLAGPEGRVQSFNRRWHDVDGDGVAELVFPGVGSGLMIMDAAGNSVREVPFEGLDGMGGLHFVPLEIDGRLHWAVARGVNRAAPFGGSAVIGLFDVAGRRLWTADPGISATDSASIELAAGDVDGDGAPEILAGLSVFRLQGSAAAATRPTRQGYLMVFDRAGSLLCAREVGQSVGHVHVVPPASASADPLIVVVSEGQIQRFSFKRAS